MKNFLLFFFLTIGLSPITQAQTSDETEIQNLIQNSFDELFSNLNSEKVGDFYTDDFLLLEQGEIWDKAIILGYFERASKNPNRPIRTNRFEFIQTKVEGNRGWVGYWNFATISRDGQVLQEIKWLESATAVKTNEGWRLDMLHSTRVEKE
jgi:ketosteroid isomerase-like protein